MFSTFTNRMRGTLLLLMAVFCLQISAQSLPSKISDGVILHCFNWKYSDIKASLSQIKAAGFVAVQTSPAQLNVTNQDNWNILYRPRDSKAGPNVLGTSSDLKALCDAAHALGIKVIVDIVANHTDGSLDWVADFWKNTDLYHNNGDANDGSRYQVTHGKIGMMDLKTEDSRVQQKFKAYVQELKSLGVDGCRWDAAKHIGLPSEGDQFWPTVIDKSMYNYGEILYTVGGGQDETLLPEYMQYMSVTDSNYGTKTLLGSFKNGGVPSAGGGWSMWLNTSKLVYWGESHDTFCNNGDASYGVDQNKIDRAYAVAAAHNAIPSLYFSRPTGGNTSGPGCQAGVKGSTHFTSKEVAEVNKFHNAMVGKEDYYSSQNGACSTTRKGGGAVIVKGKGSGKVTVPNGGGYAEAGTYTDRVSGGTFTVTATTISGSVGSSGIAVLWKDSQSSSGGGGDEPEPDPFTLPSCATVQSGTYCYFETSWSTVNVWAWTGETNVYAEWPGSSNDITKVGTNNGNDVYLWKYSGSAPANIIFNNGTDQTDDFTFTNGGYYDATGLLAVVSGSTPTPDPDPEPDPTGTTVYVKATSAPYLYAWDADGNSLAGAWPGTQMTEKSGDYWVKSFTQAPINIIFNNGSGGQTSDIENISGNCYFTYDGSAGYTTESGGGGDTSNLPTCATWQEGTFCYLEASWSSANVWAWKTGEDGSVFLGTAWPGVAMTKVGTNGGNNVYLWKHTSSALPENIIFNNGTDQTDDLSFTNGGYYNQSGALVGTVVNSTGIDAVTTLEYQTVNVYTLDGRLIRSAVPAAAAVKGLSKGLYLVGGKKVAVR